MHESAKKPARKALAANIADTFECECHSANKRCEICCQHKLRIDRIYYSSRKMFAFPAIATAPDPDRGFGDDPLGRTPGDPHSYPFRFAK